MLWYPFVEEADSVKSAVGFPLKYCVPFWVLFLNQNVEDLFKFCGTE